MQYSIPLFKLNFDEQEEKAIVETIRSRWISTGPKCEELEKTFSEMMGSKFAVSLSNCTSALHLAIVALGIEAGDEVICPSLTFVATVNSIRYVNATPVFCDIKSLEHPNIDAGKIESLITPKTKAIVVVHLAGFPCEMNEIVSLAKKYNLKVIEDACHAPLSEYNGEKLGSIGDVGASAAIIQLKKLKDDLIKRAEITIEQLVVYIGELLGFNGSYIKIEHHSGSVARRCPDTTKAEKLLNYE